MDFLIFEMLAPKEAIEARTGQTPRFFAYPSGSYDNQTVAVLQSANYWGAVVIEQDVTHTSDKLFELERVRIRGAHTVEDIQYLLTSYNW